MTHDEKFEELAALAALDLPLGEDSALFARHREEGCAVCEDLISDFRAAASALAFTAPALAPRRELKDGILASLPRERRRPARGVIWLLAAAAALLVAVIAYDDARLRREREELRSQAATLSSSLAAADTNLARAALRARVLESEDVRILFLGGKEPQPGARARVFWSEKARRGILVAGNLETLPAGKQYELWVFLDGKPVPAGVFDADPSGRALFESPALASLAAAQNFAVTIEPQGGVPAPTGPIILVGTPS